MKDAPIRAPLGLISVNFVTDFAELATSLAGKEFRSRSNTINLCKMRYLLDTFYASLTAPKPKTNVRLGWTQEAIKGHRLIQNEFNILIQQKRVHVE
jgi:hypothetical protein